MNNKEVYKSLSELFDKLHTTKMDKQTKYRLIEEEVNKLPIQSGKNGLIDSLCNICYILNRSD